VDEGRTTNDCFVVRPSSKVRSYFWTITYLSRWFMSSSEANLRVLIIADDPLTRAGLATLLTDQPGFSVVGRIATGGDLLAEVDIYRPDLLLFDLGWDPALSPASARSGQEQPPTSLDSLAELREAGLPVIALIPAETYAPEAWPVGPGGLLLRQVDSDKLVAALKAVAQGLSVFDATLSTATLPAKSFQAATLPEPLTPRELQVLRLIAEGLPNKAIARRLDISDHTVKFHVNAILTKIGAQSRTEAVVQATRLGLILL
jgi:DNA-binding NarL/FixJ family response regulator